MNFINKVCITCLCLLPTLFLNGAQQVQQTTKITAATANTAKKKKKKNKKKKSAKQQVQPSYTQSQSASGVGCHEESAQAKSSDANETVSAHSSTTATTPVINTSSSANSSTAVTSTTHATQDQEQKKEKESKSDDTVKKYCEQLKQQLLKRYQPTAETSRPSIRAANNTKKYEDAQSLLNGSHLEPTLACILAGHKDVGMITMPETNPKIPDNIRILCDQENILFIPIAGNPLSIIVCQSAASGLGALAYKYYYIPKSILKKLGIYCPYSYGFFYGYPEEDIKAYYAYLLDNPNSEHDYEITTNSFETDKKTFLAWVEESEKDLQDWINSHPSDKLWAKRLAEYDTIN